MLDRATIPFVHWQMRRDTDGGAVLGEISAEFEDLHQEIRQCILTPKRSVPLNPEKGCDLQRFRDRPMNARHLFLGAEIREALARDVPRIEVNEVSVVGGFSTVSVSITWVPTALVASEFITTEVDFAFD